MKMDFTFLIALVIDERSVCGFGAVVGNRKNDATWHT
jgi:hypothetical protein